MIYALQRIQRGTGLRTSGITSGPPNLPVRPPAFFPSALMPLLALCFLLYILSMDTIPAEKRSIIMSKIRSKDTQPELKVRKLLYSLGFRYRLHGKKVPGKPDIVFKGKKKVIFVHGCFWHQHADCVHGGIPKSRQEYWEPKLLKNIERDQIAQTKLKEVGWDFLIVWECQIDDIELLSKQLKAFLTP